MAKIKSENANEKVKKPIILIEKSTRKTSLKEFSISNNIRPEVEAGFKIWLGENLNNSDEEWSILYEKYSNRKINGGE